MKKCVNEKNGDSSILACSFLCYRLIPLNELAIKALKIKKIKIIKKLPVISGISGQNAGNEYIVISTIGEIWLKLGLRCCSSSDQICYRDPSGSRKPEMKMRNWRRALCFVGGLWSAIPFPTKNTYPMLIIQMRLTRNFAGDF
jgi:hypothetical protein